MSSAFEALGACVVAAQTPVELMAGISHALLPPPPQGKPSVIQHRVNLCNTAFQQYTRYSSQVAAVATKSLAAWRGPVGETAAQTVNAIGDRLAAVAELYQEGASVYMEWADALTWAQAKDAEGVEQLEQAWHATQPALLNPVGAAALSGARKAAAQGIEARAAAAKRINSASATTTSQLTELANQNPVTMLTDTQEIDPVDATVLADAWGPHALILSPEQIQQATTVLGRLPASDQHNVLLALHDAGSPQQAAAVFGRLAELAHPTTTAARQANADGGQWLTRLLTDPHG
jgi:hypothetical protein